MRKLLAGLSVAAALCGCVNAGTPSDVETAAEAVYARIAAADLVGLKAMSAPELRAQETQALVDQMAGQIPKEPPTSGQTTSWQINTNLGSPTEANVKRTYKYPSGEVLFDVVMQKDKDGKTWRVVGMHVMRNQPTPGAGQ